LKASEKSLFYAGGSSTGSSSIIVRRLASGDLLERFVLSRKHYTPTNKDALVCGVNQVLSFCRRNLLCQ
jgi:hypothetical protein